MTLQLVKIFRLTDTFVFSVPFSITVKAIENKRFVSIWVGWNYILLEK